MYSIVLATMLTTGVAAPEWRGGCHGCCGGCYGCCGGCYGCCGGCWGCYGCCGGCWGCYGCCGGCWGCYGCCGGCYGCGGGWGVGYYSNCYGCWGTCFGCHGCYGCYGCYGSCYGGVAVAAASPVIAPAAVVPNVQTVPTTPVLPTNPKRDDQSTSLGNAAAVVLKAPQNVQLSVEGISIPRTASEETFRTPVLEPGYSYTYTFKARVVREGKAVSYSKQVKVRAGQTTVADFTRLANEGKDAARITVKLPSDARLYVDNVLCPLTSATRTFNTPELQAGQRYYYTLRAEVVRDGETLRSPEQKVLVEAGKQVTVEFKDLPVHTVSR